MSAELAFHGGVALGYLIARIGVVNAKEIDHERYDGMALRGLILMVFERDYAFQYLT